MSDSLLSGLERGCPDDGVPHTKYSGRFGSPSTGGITKAHCAVSRSHPSVFTFALYSVSTPHSVRETGLRGMKQDKIQRQNIVFLFKFTLGFVRTFGFRAVVSLRVVDMTLRISSLSGRGYPDSRAQILLGHFRFR